MLMNINKLQLEAIKDIGPVVGDNIYNSTHPSRELCEVIFAID